MNSLYEMEQKRSKALKSYRSKQEKLRKQKEAIEQKERKLRYPAIYKYLDKLGKAALPLIKGAEKFEVYGPFGMGSECSIYFSAKQKPGEKEPKTLAGATFTRYGDGYGLKDYSKNTKQFKKGSIGELNRMNYPTIEITEKMTLDWFVKFAKKGYNKK